MGVMFKEDETENHRNILVLGNCADLAVELYSSYAAFLRYCSFWCGLTHLGFVSSRL